MIATIHGETLHNHYHGNTLDAGQISSCSTAAPRSAMHYAGDLTSTFPVDGTFTAAQRDVYQVVLDAHLAAVAAVKPGVRSARSTCWPAARSPRASRGSA